METGIAGDDDDFMAEKANPPMQALLSSSSSAPEGLSMASPRSSAPPDNSGSPAITKVQAAIEARAHAEGSKASLKAASQQRQLDRRRRLEEERDAHDSAGGDDGDMDGDDGRGGERKGMVNTVRERVGSAADYEDVPMPVPVAAGVGPEGGGGPADVEDSIQRTQMFLRQRLAQRSKGSSAADARSAAAAYATGDGGGEAGAALDAQELAAQAYERQRATRGEEGNSQEFAMGAPKLSPARPVNSINGMGFSPGRLDD